MNGGRKRSLLASSVAMLALAFAGVAHGATKPAAWQKLAAAYTAQARAHGYTADCTPWNRVLSMHCWIKKGGQAGLVSPAWHGDGCTVTVSFTQTQMVAQHVDVDTCKRAWWTTPLPAPWIKDPADLHPRLSPAPPQAS